MKDKDRKIVHAATYGILDIVFLFLVFLLAFLLAFNNISEPDAFWHLKLGQYILDTHSLPYKDIFSYTLAGTPVFPVEWLFEVIWFFIYKHTGIAGLIIAKSMIAGLTAALLYLSALNYRVNRYIGFAVISGIFIAAGFYFADRPQLITYLFIALFVYLISLYDNGHRHLIWLLPLIMLLWFNMHPGAVFGLIFLTGWVFEGFARLLKKEIKTSEYLNYLAVFIAACAASFITPSTYHLYTFLFHHVASLGVKGGLEYINEFKAPNLITDPIMLIMLSVFAAALVTSINRIPFRYVFFGFIMIPMAYGMERMVIVTFIGTVCGVCMVIDKAVSLLKRYKLVSKPFYIAIAALPFLFVLHQYRTDDMGYKSVGIYRSIYPDRAIDFILKHKMKGNIYNEMNFGGALIFLGYPEIRDFIDTRLTPEKVLLPKVANAMESPQAFQSLMHEYNVTYALISTGDPLDYSKLFPEPQWTLVYFDDYAQIYVKRNTGNDELISKYGYRVFNPHSFIYTFEAFVSPQAYFTTPGLFKELQRLVKEVPYSAMAHLAYGVAVIYDNADYTDGLKQIDTAKQIMPYSPTVLLWYGIEHGLNGNIKTMEKSFDTVSNVISGEEHFMNTAVMNYIMGYYYYVAGQKNQAVKSLKTAVRLDPKLSQAQELLDRIQ